MAPKRRNRQVFEEENVGVVQRQAAIQEAAVAPDWDTLTPKGSATLRPTMKEVVSHVRIILWTLPRLMGRSSGASFTLFDASGTMVVNLYEQYFGPFLELMSHYDILLRVAGLCISRGRDGTYFGTIATRTAIEGITVEHIPELLQPPEDPFFEQDMLTVAAEADNERTVCLVLHFSGHDALDTIIVRGEAVSKRVYTVRDEENHESELTVMGPHADRIYVVGFYYIKGAKIFRLGLTVWPGGMICGAPRESHFDISRATTPI